MAAITKRLAFALCLLSTSALAQFAPQEWSADQSGVDLWSLSHVTTIQADNMSGVGTRFACTDSTGQLIPSATACVASGSAVSSVTGSGGLACSPTTGAVSCTLGSFACPTGEFASGSSTSGLSCTLPSYGTWVDGAFTPLPQEPFSAVGGGLTIADDPSDAATVISLPLTGSPGSCTYCSLTFDALGRETARASGTAPVTSVGGTSPISCSGSPTATCSITGGANQVQVGTGSNIGGFTDFLYSNTAAQLEIGATAFPAFAGNIDITQTASPALITIHSASSGAGDYAGFINYLGASLTAAPYQQIFIPVLANTTFGPSGSAIFDAASSGSGQVRFGNSAAGLGVDLYTGTSRTTRVHLASAGDWDFVSMAAPSSPASGSIACYGDSTSLNIACKTSGGTVNHGVQTDSGTASQWIRAIADTGAVTKSQPAFTDVSGTETCGQSAGPYTGSVVKAANSCATKVVAIDESGGLNIPIGACTTDGQAFVKVAGSMTCRLPTVDLANDYTAPWVVGVHDGASAQWTTSGTWAAGQILVTAASNHISTEATATCAQLPALTGDVTKASGSCATVVANVACSALPALTGQVTKTAGSCATVIAPGVLTTSLAYYVAAVNPILGGGFLETSSSVSTLSSSDIPYPLGVAATTGRLRINILANSIVTSLGTGVITFTVFSNGVNNFSTTALTTVAAGTQVDTGLNSALGTTAATDGWSVKITSTGTYVSGSITFTAVLVMGY